jgi:hypothetical protein
MNLKLFCLLCFFSPELLIHFDILNKSKVLSKMSSNQPALMTTNTFKNVAKNYSQLALMSE